VGGSQVALAASNYLLLALAARHLSPAGFAAVSAYYLLINTVGRGLFAAVELETTRAVAAGAHGTRAAVRHTGVLLVGALVLLGLAAPLLTGGAATVALLAVGAITMAASYLIRGPLAGLRRYGRYAATFWVEAGAGLAAAVVVTVVDEHATAAWTAVLALAPGVAPLLLGGWWRGAVRSSTSQECHIAATGSEECHIAATSWQECHIAATGSEECHIAATGSEECHIAATGSGATAGPARTRGVAPVGPVLWSAALLLAGQGVWNLAPVLVTARLTDAATLAAGFTTVAVVVRAPVLLFPTIQAMLLPRLAGGARTPRPLVAAVVGAGILWVAVATVAVPLVAALVFATTAPPAAWIVALLALSVALGTVAQVAQAQMVAARRTHAAAMAWLAGLVALLAIGLAAAPPIAAATIGQLAAAGLVLGALVIAGRKP
jgi:O-antigen/teichoic acid export membrane protein